MTGVKMRRSKAGWILGVALVLVSSGASASDTGKGETGGKGGLGPTAAPAPTETLPEKDVPLQRNVQAGQEEKSRPWEIGADFETHRMIRQDDLEGASGRNVFNIFGIAASYNLTQHDTIGVREFISEGFYADQGETGVRADDVAATYTHVQPLPRDFSFSGTLAVSAPTSLASQKSGTITAPTLILGLNKRIGRYVSVGFHVNGSYIIAKYAEAEGGAPNGQGRVAGSLSAEVVMPFHEPLSIGATASTSYIWFYQVNGATGYGVVNDGTYPNQPIQQNYGGEVFANYTLPSLAGLKSDFAIHLAQGDPGLGYTTYLHDGIGQFYLFYRQDSEVYASFSVRY
jgi:hypothetical protein